MQSSATSTRTFVLGVLAVALVASAVVYVLISKVAEAAQSPSDPLFFALLTGILLAGLPLFWYWRVRELPAVATLGILFLIAVAIFLASVYLFRTSSYIATKADILTWTESGYVGNIIKFRTGTPLYTAPADNNTTLYPPGTEVLTYLIAAALGQGASVPFYRGLHLAYIFLASIIATVSCVSLARMVFPDHHFRYNRLWVAFWFPALFLIATNPVTSPFAHTLSTDATRLLFVATAFWLMLKHTSTEDDRWLIPMAILPAAGFLVKQSLAAWVGIFVVYLLVRQPARIQWTVTFFAASVVSLAGVLGICWLLWGRTFFYWTFEVLQDYPVSPLRVFDHAVKSWIFIALGCWGGWVLLRGKTFHRLLPVWLAWLLLMSIELYTSGIAWVLHHMAPASLIAGVWFLVGLAKVWPEVKRVEVDTSDRIQPFLQTALAAALVCFLFAGMGYFRLPVKPVSADLDRYIEQIEREFREVPTDKVLLDAGNWVYLTDDAVVKDRAAPIVDQATSGLGDVSQTIRRIREKQYAKILVRRLHSENFLYEWVPGNPDYQSGIRAVLLENYHEVRRIRSVQGTEWLWNYLIGEMFVLEPNDVPGPPERVRSGEQP